MQKLETIHSDELRSAKERQAKKKWCTLFFQKFVVEIVRSIENVWALEIWQTISLAKIGMVFFFDTIFS